MKNRARYVLIRPRWVLLVVVIRGVLTEAAALGPTFSSQVWSVIWEAISWPKPNVSFGERRWMIGGKNPSRFEKRWVGRLVAGFSSWPVKFPRSRANKKPNRVTAKAAVFTSSGMVISGVFRGVIFEVINKPARMLPQARRLIGLVMAGSVSFIWKMDRGVRGFPRATKIIRRRL